MSHDGDEHIKYNYLGDKCCTEEVGYGKHVLELDPAGVLVILIGAPQTLLVEVTKKQEILADDATTVQRSISCIILWEDLSSILIACLHPVEL